MSATKAVVRQLLSDNTIDTIIHFAGSIIVPESVKSLAYFATTPASRRTLIARRRRPDQAFHIFLQRGRLWHARAQSR